MTRLLKFLNRYLLQVANVRFLVFLIATVLVSCVATYAAFAKLPPFGNNPDYIVWLLNIDLILLILLVIILSHNLLSIWGGRKKNVAGSRLYARLTLIFSVIAGTPAILMAVFSMFFFHFGVQTWFSETVKGAVTNSYAVAESYLDEYQQNIKADILAMASDIDRQAMRVLEPRVVYTKTLDTQALLRNLQEAIIFEKSGEIIARSGLTFTLTFETVPDFLLEQAAEGEVVVLTNEEDDRVRALVRLNSYSDAYLFVGRSIDPVVLSNVVETQDAASKYRQLEENYSTIQTMLMLIFVILALLLIFIAIIVAVALSRQLVKPISAMINASERVSAGDFTTRIQKKYEIDDFDYLVRSFNRMTEQIDKQQKELINANRQLDYRRRRTETVLTSISTGVLAIDHKRKLTVANDAACSILGKEKTDLVESNIDTLLPDLKESIDKAYEEMDRSVEHSFSYETPQGDTLSLLAKVTVEVFEGQKSGILVTLNDVTDLKSAQKKAAWADVAQRIAHEIKNPLTPIQLSAERLKRRYSDQIEGDKEVFDLCVDTIIKRVEDIGNMVSEFSDFARMPQASIKMGPIFDTIREAVLLQQTAYPDIDVQQNGIEDIKDLVIPHDRVQTAQVFTNVVKNALEASQQDDKVSDDPKLCINYLLANEQLYVIISDNGPGFPESKKIDTLTDPYVTHKENGTGLGLAIVSKIMVDHNGKLVLGADNINNIVSEKWNNLGGANVMLVFPLKQEINNKVAA